MTDQMQPIKRKLRSIDKIKALELRKMTLISETLRTKRVELEQCNGEIEKIIAKLESTKASGAVEQLLSHTLSSSYVLVKADELKEKKILKQHIESEISDLEVALRRAKGTDNTLAELTDKNTQLLKEHINKNAKKQLNNLVSRTIEGME